MDPWVSFPVKRFDFFPNFPAVAFWSEPLQWSSFPTLSLTPSTTQSFVSACNRNRVDKQRIIGQSVNALQTATGNKSRTISSILFSLDSWILSWTWMSTARFFTESIPWSMSMRFFSSSSSIVSQVNLKAINRKKSLIDKFVTFSWSLQWILFVCWNFWTWPNCLLSFLISDLSCFWNVTFRSHLILHSWNIQLHNSLTLRPLV